LNSNVSRFQVTSFYSGDAPSVNGSSLQIGFSIRNPRGGEDSRSAGQLSQLLYAEHLNRTSDLYTYLPYVDPAPSSFQTSWTITLPAGSEPGGGFPYKLVTGLIIGAILLWCCLIALRSVRFKRLWDSRNPEKKPQRPTVSLCPRVVAMYAYQEDQADRSRDLIFEAGDIINVVSHESSDGPAWIVGERNGITGMVPKGFVKPHGPGELLPNTAA